MRKLVVATILGAAVLLPTLLTGASGAASAGGTARLEALSTSFEHALTVYATAMEADSVSSSQTQALTQSTFDYVEGITGLVTPECLQRHTDELLSDATRAAGVLEGAEASAQANPDGTLPKMTKAVERYIGAFAAQLKAITTDTCAGPAPTGTGSAPLLSVSSVAADAHLTRVTECGPIAEFGAGTSTGTGWRSGTKYGISTFASRAQRDDWLTATTPLGVTPSQEGATWVVYRALEQSPGCS